jgi:hypothetical protein
VKITISIPDATFKDAERFAKRRGWSRSELYASAVAQYVSNEKSGAVRAKLDLVYGANGEDSSVETLLATAQSQVVIPVISR